MAVQFSILEKNILRLLHTKPQTLEELSLRLDESQQATTKAISFLIEHRIPIIFCPNKNHYQLQIPWQEINPEQIKKELNQTQFEFLYFDTIDSTNTYLKQKQFNNQNIICISEMQNAGRGRLGREWSSPFGVNLYLSLRTKLKCPVSALSGLSPVIGLALCEAIESTIKISPNHIKLKWPNDLIYNNKKLGGILIEIIYIEANACEVVIGIGLNVNGIPKNNLWASLQEINRETINRDHLLISIIKTAFKFIEIYTEHGFQNFLSAWDKKDILRDKEIFIYKTRHQLQGTAKGLNKKGQLLFLDSNNIFHELDSGEVSLKPVS
jgi:BirA family biotin operon repressor/biotin-[acetyl-CoA-carboxylase] ligase